VGSGRERRDIPRLAGVSSRAPRRAVLEDGLVDVQRGRAWNWMSGASSSELERMNRRPSADVRGQGPRPSLTKGARFASVSESNSETGSS